MENRLYFEDDILHAEFWFTTAAERDIIGWEITLGRLSSIFLGEATELNMQKHQKLEKEYQKKIELLEQNRR